MTRIESPCVACCKLDEQDVCQGCYRTLAEIANWNRRTEAEKADILARLPARAEAYRREAEGPTHPITRKAVLAVKEH
ncbi:DUF1289 domain-containing protein [Ferrimonas balearica]|uniref:DUF1289 domain-containing protein n=1 Tax=Ferrimonas balearica TaxID=44012 RepID=UPI001F466BF5|nr:DUF1289 domain-containing protein [Ferrimonas balearica]MBY6018597.1 DUF1289 domain-containing protein [Halomonas denitrificans]MBY6096452.1 DUF1289 domain-containing protein [Ferrimonas balearica]